MISKILNSAQIIHATFVFNSTKNTLQLNSLFNIHSSGRIIQPGMISIFTNIVRHEHIVGLWRGMVPSIVRCVPGVGLYFSSLYWLKNKIGKTRNDNLSALEAVTLGVIARTMSGVALIPITVIKTR